MSGKQPSAIERALSVHRNLCAAASAQGFCENVAPIREIYCAGIVAQATDRLTEAMRENTRVLTAIARSRGELPQPDDECEE